MLSAANPIDKYKLSVTRQGQPNVNLKSLVIPADTYVVEDGIIFECYSSGTYDITLENEDGVVIYSGTINAVENNSYFIYVPGLTPDEDTIN